ncbi:broad-complex core protein isoforms 1/2/3/4/5 isoform X2 [Cryptotermes secundus]|uniref:broad-complex core protein isoforms 1/2/3/4/5 isoform X2 n=1 Tax=Cryptotermes secundus TaxID=105785 RepID=UPI000CD7B84E|nr:broad-complex core protein isoforms 1/2/3/4/5 isoform X2 [Cryptotermes secundus]
MGTGQQFSLRWNNYLRHITCAFDSLRSDEDLVDVTLSCEGKRIRAHKMLLSACSTYFRDLFKENPCQHPVIIFRNVKFEDLAALIDFMYQGEVNVVQDQLASFLTTAELLAVQGLSDGNGKDQGSDQPKEVELPDSPIMPPEPEVQLSNNTHGQKQMSSGSGSVSSPVSFFPVDQRSDSPPSSKRRKWGSGVGGSAKSGNSSAVPSSGTVEKDVERERETERRRVSAVPASSSAQSTSKSSPDPIEIIPVVPNLKLEMPDYMEQEQDASSCSYSDSNQGGGGAGGGGQGSSRDPLPPMSQLLARGASTSADNKPEPTEMYSANSGDSTLPPSGESLSASDISQILAKPGPSGENQSQDSLQENFRPTAQLYLASQLQRAAGNPCRIICTICGRGFSRRDSFAHHKRTHLEQMKCPVCHKLFTRSHDVKRHILKVHARDVNVKSEHCQFLFSSELTTTVLTNDSHHIAHFRN